MSVSCSGTCTWPNCHRAVPVTRKIAHVSGAVRIDGGGQRPLPVAYVQGKRPDKKLARGGVLPLLLKIDGIVGLETAFALKMAP